MRLTVCLEGNTEGRVLASVDMEEIVKMTITDDIEKSNFNPQMLKACTDTSYECGYEKGRADAERDFQNSDYWNDYLAKVIADAKAELFNQMSEILSVEMADCKTCPIGCEVNTYGGCQEEIKKYLLEQIE